MLSIKAISFDLDDTLWECESVIARAEVSMLRFINSHCLCVKDALDMESYTVKKKIFMKSNSHLKGDVTRMRMALLTELLANCHENTNMVKQAFDHFYSVRSEVVFYPDALSSLKHLVKKYPLAALTNGNADLDQIGITHLFQKIIYASLEQPAKPHPYMFEQTCEAFEINPEELLHVGDNPETDIEGARRVGVKTVWINRLSEVWPSDICRANYEVENLYELIELIELISG